MKNQKGITLIALIITVIIMVILAIFAISSLTGEKGLVNTVQNALNEWRNAENYEQALIEGTLTNMQSTIDAIHTGNPE